VYYHLQLKHNYICLWYYKRIITATCFCPICGPSSGFDQTLGSVIPECVERSFLGSLVEGGGGGGGGRDLAITVGTMVPGFIRQITIKS